MKSIVRSLDRMLSSKIDHMVDDRLSSPFGPMARYQGGYSTLDIEFAEGSEPRVISVPYRPFENRATVHLPYRLVKVDE